MRETHKHLFNALDISVSKVLKGAGAASSAEAVLVLSRLQTYRDVLKAMKAEDTNVFKGNLPCPTSQASSEKV